MLRSWKRIYRVCGYPEVEKWEKSINNVRQLAPLLKLLVAFSPGGPAGRFEHVHE